MFGTAGATFVAVQCTVEKVRARHDLYNTVFGGIGAGAILGAVQARRAATLPAVARAVTVNAASFAAMAVAFELLSQHVKLPGAA